MTNAGLIAVSAAALFAVSGMAWAPDAVGARLADRDARAATPEVTAGQPRRGGAGVSVQGQITPRWSIVVKAAFPAAGVSGRGRLSLMEARPWLERTAPRSLQWNSPWGLGLSIGLACARVAEREPLRRTPVLG
jgi:hypothetical protein